MNVNWRLPGHLLFALGAVLLACACGARSELLEATADRAPADASPPDAAPADASPPDAAPADVEPLRCDRSTATLPGLWVLRGAPRASVVAVALGPDSSLFVIGEFSGTVDFDPGPAEDVHASIGGTDVFVTKLFCDGTYGWTRTWGGLDSPVNSGWGDSPESLAVMPDGAVLISGQYCSTVDFDPGPGTDVRMSNSCFDGFVTKLAADGAYAWTRTFGGAGRDRVGSVAVSQDGAIFITGQFEFDVDFDPGPGVDLHTSEGSIDRFVVKLTSGGELLWARTWGGQETEFNGGNVAVVAGGAVLVGGQFQGLVDFDPGPDEDMRMSAGSDDAFVMRFASDGAREWAVTWGGDSAEEVTDLALAPDGSILVSGYFYGDADFDPGPGTDVHVKAGAHDAYVTRLEPDGSHRWTRTWGAAAGAGFMTSVEAWAMSLREDGGVIVVGSFQGAIDFDPGLGVDTMSATSKDLDDAVVSALDANGEYAWSRRVGGDGYAIGGAVTLVGDTVVLGGQYSGTVDFDPGSGTSLGSAAGEADAFVLSFVP